MEKKIKSNSIQHKTLECEGLIFTSYVLEIIKLYFMVHVCSILHTAQSYVLKGNNHH